MYFLINKILFIFLIQKSFVWRQDDKIIYKAWSKKASLRYSSFCSDAQAKWEKGQQDNRIAMHVWLRWVEFWKTPDFQVKSTTQKKNRKGGAEKYPPTHTGGSASLRTHAAVLVCLNFKQLEYHIYVLWCCIGLIKTD